MSNYLKSNVKFIRVVDGDNTLVCGLILVVEICAQFGALLTARLQKSWAYLSRMLIFSKLKPSATQVTVRITLENVGKERLISTKYHTFLPSNSQLLSVCVFWAIILYLTLIHFHCSASCRTFRLDSLSGLLGNRKKLLQGTVQLGTEQVPRDTRWSS